MRIQWRLIGLFVVLLVELLAFMLWTAPAGLDAAGLLAYCSRYGSDLLTQAAPTILLAFGMTLVLTTAGIDLSAGSMTALIACIMASFAGSPSFWWTAVPAGFVCGLSLGLLNGLLIAFLDVPPIIATLASMIFFRGLCFVIMGDLEKAPFLSVPGYEFLGEPAGAAILVLLYASAAFLYARSKWRLDLRLLGGNWVAARYAGVPVNRRLCEVYALMGILAFLAALSFTARNSSVTASSMTGLELHVIVAVILGGTKVEGGGGTLIGSLLGVLLIAVLDEGLRSAAIWGDNHLPFKLSHLQYIFLGGLLLAGVWLTSRTSARKPS